MAEYRSSSHMVYDIKYHFVWITKYRYKILKRNVAFRLRELLQHPRLIMQYLKGRPSKMLQEGYFSSAFRRL